MYGKGILIFGVVTGVITTLCSVVGTVDQIKNGDKRAAIAGAACGEKLDELNTQIITDPKTGKKFKKGLFGSMIELD